MNGLNTFKYFFVTYGGVGAHMMLDIFSNIEMVDYNNHQKHHIRIPPTSFGGNCKVVYQYGDPYNAILSYFRRRKSEYRTWTRDHCEHIRGDYTKMNTNWDVKDYLKNGEDLFKIEEHFDNWTNITNKDYDVCLFKYEDTQNNLDSLYDYLNITNYELDYRKRKSDWRNEDEETISLLEGMYGDFHKKYEDAPSFKVY